MHKYNKPKMPKTKNLRRMKEMMGDLEIEVGRTSRAFDIKKLREPIDYHLTIPKGKYEIDFNIEVKPNGLLEIAPGALFLFSMDKGLTCHGPIMAMGEEEEQIKFTSLFNNWRNISIFNKSSKGSILRYCIISRGTGIDITTHYSDAWLLRFGGALAIYKSDLKLENCTISNNQAVEGAGLSLIDSKCEINKLLVKDNICIPDKYLKVYSGGGISVQHSEIHITDSIIEKNMSFIGGGVSSSWNSILLIENSKIRKNTATNSLRRQGGGGLYISGDSTISDCFIEDNYSDRNGGGIYLDEGEASVIKSTIRFNRSKQSGGGIGTYHAKLLLKDCKICSNETELKNGGGLYAARSSVSFIDTEIENNMAAGNKSNYYGS